MLIRDMDKIIIRKTIKGINCLECGGILKEIEKKTMTGKIIKVLTLGIIETTLYECESCGKKYLVTR
jgi:uncharacterized protein with PIN domain